MRLNVLTMKVRLTSCRGISPFLHSFGQGIINLPQTVRCDSSCSTVMGILQKSHLTSLLGQSSCKWALSMDFSNSFPQRFGHITGTNLQSSKWAYKICNKVTIQNTWKYLYHINLYVINIYYMCIVHVSCIILKHIQL